MRLIVVGSNGTYPLAGKPASGYLVATGSGSVLLDIGPGVAPHLIDRLPDAIFISHRHPDHCLDLLPLFNHLRFDHPQRWGIPVFAPQGVFAALAEFAGAGPDHDLHRVFHQQVVSPGEVVEAAGARLAFGRAEHPVPALSVRVEAEAVLAYSGDTGPGGDLVRVSRGADVLLCEATHQGEPPPDRYPYHLYAMEAGMAATEAGAGRLLVTHVAPRLDPKVSVEEASRHFEGPVSHAEPGLEVEF